MMIKIKSLHLCVNYSYKTSVYYYACTCTFNYALCYTGAMCKDMKYLLQCFTRDKSGI